MYSRLKKLQEGSLYLKNFLSEEHQILIQNLTDNSKEKELLKKFFGTNTLYAVTAKQV